MKLAKLNSHNELADIHRYISPVMSNKKVNSNLKLTVKIILTVPNL